MNSRKQLLVAVTMLILVSTPMVIFLSWKVQRLMVRHEMMKKLEHAQLQTIEIPVSSVQWYEKGKEIIVDGKLFDVASYHLRPDAFHISFTGLFDEAETAIEEKAKRYLQQKEKNDTGINLLSWLFFSPLQDVQELTHSCTIVNNSFSNFITDHIPVADISIPAPPPKA